MQDFGQPPAELVGDLSSGQLPLDAQGNPDLNQCSLMWFLYTQIPFIINCTSKWKICMLMLIGNLLVLFEQNVCIFIII